MSLKYIENYAEDSKFFIECIHEIQMQEITIFVFLLTILVDQESQLILLKP